jgi:hypothetical protein
MIQQELAASNPDAAPPGTGIPCETAESIDLNDTTEERARAFLLQRAQNFSIYHNTVMENVRWKRVRNRLELRISHKAKPDA